MTELSLLDQLEAVRQRGGTSQTSFAKLADELLTTLEPLHGLDIVGTKALPFSFLNTLEKEAVAMIEEQDARAVATGVLLLHQTMELSPDLRLRPRRQAVVNGLQKLFSPEMQAPAPIVADLCKNLRQKGWSSFVSTFMLGTALPVDAILKKADHIPALRERMELRFFALDSARNQAQKTETISLGILNDLEKRIDFFAAERLEAYATLIEKESLLEDRLKQQGPRKPILDRALAGYLDIIPCLDEGEEKLERYLAVYNQFRASKSASGLIGKIKGTLDETRTPRKRWNALRAIAGNSDSHLWGTTSREEIQEALLNETDAARSPEHKLLQLWNLFIYTPKGLGSDFEKAAFRKMLSTAAEKGALSPQSQARFCLFVAAQNPCDSVQRGVEKLLKTATENLDPSTLIKLHTNIMEREAPTLEGLFREWGMMVSKERRHHMMEDENDHPVLGKKQGFEGMTPSRAHLSMEAKTVFEKIVTQTCLKKIEAAPTIQKKAITADILKQVIEPCDLLAEAQKIYLETSGLKKSGAKKNLRPV